jgi:uncharacterized protein
MTPQNEIPPDQALCRSCGLCCDGMIFACVPLSAEEKDFMGNPVVPGAVEGQYRFKQPCGHYQAGVCRIYDAGRPKSCVGFKCKLLHRYQKGGLSFDQAALVIKETRSLAARMRTSLGGGVSLDLGAIYMAWEETQQKKGTADWKKEHQALLLDYAALHWGLKRHFQAGNKIMPTMDPAPARRA